MTASGPGLEVSGVTRGVETHFEIQGGEGQVEAFLVLPSGEEKKVGVQCTVQSTVGYK